MAYVGGGWCPYCALGNWPLQVALSQFGTFTQLGGPQSSSPTDVYPGLKSWSFTGARYVSKYFKLDAFEASQNLSRPYPANLNALVTEVRPGPYTQTAGGIPFTDLGDHFLVIGAPSSVAPLMHLSQAQVAADLRHPDSAVARTVDGAANYLVAAMCLTPGASSAPICASKFAQRLDAKWAPSFPTTTTTTTTTYHYLRPSDHDHDGAHHHELVNDYNDLGNVDEHDDHRLPLERRQRLGGQSQNMGSSLYGLQNFGTSRARGPGSPC